MEKDKKEKKTKKGWKKYLIIGGVVLLVIAAVSGIRAITKPKPTNETAKVEKGRVSQDLVLTGSVLAEEDASLFFPVSGELIWVGVKEGVSVKKGQAIAQLSMVALRAAVSQAESNVRDARATVDKIHDDVKGHDADETYLQKQTRTSAEVSYDNAYQALLVAQDNIRKDVLRSPFAGVVSNLVSAYPGINVSAGVTVAEVVNPESIYFEVTADQTEVKELKVGQKGRIVLDSSSDEELGMSIKSISLTPKEGEAGTVYVVKVGFDKLDADKIRIGMTGDARFASEEKESVLYVPPKFLGSDNKGRFLKVGSPDKKVYVEVGLQGDERVEVIGGVKEGDVIYD